MAHRALRTIPALLFLALLAAAAARAQISPGDLARPHAALEGSANCQRCHSARRGVAPEACLACHTRLGERIKAARGLHAGPKFARCEVCHIEHQGRAFALIDWGPGGMTKFDHAQTGYALAGAHAGLACEKCHKPRPASSAEGTSAATFLGLSADCVTCHRDEHRGQFAGRPCTDCHGMTAWKPAAAFDHARSDFPLVGKHAAVACAKCHTARVAGAGEPAVAQYRGVAHATCADCHRDPHAGRLGPRCDSCHDAKSWQPSSPAAFDHDRTRYPLAGRHRAVACAACHGPADAGFRRPAFARCTDCHRDAHFGQLAARPDHGACESCHSVAGWSPSTYTVEAHQSSRYALTGAHLAVPCLRCHANVAAASRGTATAAAGRQTTPRLHWSETRCITCHQDPHGSDLSEKLRRAACEDCHETAAWSQVRFDHGWTKFPLGGKHAALPCARCHRPEAAPRQPARLQLQRPIDCAACHRDPHAGQFAGQSCTRCHGDDDWHRLRFAHDRDSRYKLDGAHAKLPCAACHRSVAAPGGSFVRYKPLPVDCQGCHAPAR